MCLPAALAAVPALLSAAGGASTALTAASSVVSTVGAITAGVGQYQQAKAAEQMARQQAQDALNRGDQAAADLAKEQSGFRGRQTAALAASGVELGYGSADQIQQDTLSMQREDQRRLKDNARREAWGYSVEGAMQRSAAKGAIINTALTAGSTLLAGASKTYAGYKANKAPAGKPYTGFGPGV